MGSAKGKKGGSKRGHKAVAPAADDLLPQPPNSKQKRDDAAVAVEQELEPEPQPERPVVEAPAAEPSPSAQAAPSRSSSTQSASVAPLSIAAPPAIPSHLAHLPACPIRFSTFDCARKLRLSPSQLSILGDKGYRTCRATHGLSAGSLYFELTYMPSPSAFAPHNGTAHAAATNGHSHLPPPAVRVGVSTLQADIDGCVGMDRWGYGASSRGWRGHEGVWEEWEGGGWQPGDVIGVHLTLGADEPRGLRSHSADGGQEGAGGRTASSKGGKGGKSKSKGGRGRGAKHLELQAMYEKELQQRRERREREREDREREKDKHGNGATPNGFAANAASSPTLTAGGSVAEQEKVALLLSQQKATIFFLSSALRFYRNGQPLSSSPAFSNLFRGVYYPTVSLYMQAEVAVNFGPHFAHCPADVSGGWYDKRGVEVLDDVEGADEWVDDEMEREERRRWVQEERMEELRDRGLLRHYAESDRAALIDNSRHLGLKMERERDKLEEEREKERRQKEKEERERKERLEKEREKEMREQRQAGNAAARRGLSTVTLGPAAVAV